MNLETEIRRELWQAVRRSYESQAWTNAILDAVHFLGDALRSKSGLQSDGAALVGQALGGKSPALKLNRLETESDLSVQAGVEQLLRGIYQAVRNPRSHERVEDAQQDCDRIVVFIDYLLGLIGHARAVLSTQEFVSRVLDREFVASKRYAELLVSEIPTRQRLQVSLAVFREKKNIESEKLKTFFSAMMAALPDDSIQELLEAISSELRENLDPNELQKTFQVVGPSHWTKLNEVSRLRSEGRIIKNVVDGRYQRATDKCLAGGVATWSCSYWSHFTLKKELLRAVRDKLRSEDSESRDYAVEYCFSYIDSLVDEPPPGFELFLIERLEAGDVRFKDAIEGSYLWEDKKWGPALLKALESFQAADDLDLSDSDIPF